MLPDLSKYTGGNPAGYYLSEKLNGVRALWNGREFTSKNGKTFAVPGELLQLMPADLQLDGELYAAGDLGRIAGLCRRKIPAYVAEWHGVTFEVFDVADRSLDFAERLELLTNYQTAHELPGFLRIVKQTVCSGYDELLTNYQTIKGHGGEGLVLKSPRHLFRPGASELAQKIKYLDDFEINGITYDENGRFVCVRDYE